MSSSLSHVELNGQKLPRFFYGTAWKEEATPKLVTSALDAGFRAIDTANQRKHYFEEGVGQGIADYLQKTGTQREDFFLQTKFTYTRGQDHRKPYNGDDPFSRQVQDSFESSKEHLNTTFIDSYVLHGPYSPKGVGGEDRETWQTMESFVQKEEVRWLGLSNVSPLHLEQFLEIADVLPTFVQNRCFARFQWDKEVREICDRNGILYQGFSLLTANVTELSQPWVTEIAAKYKKTIPQIVFRFAQQLGMITLTGTTDPQHMRDDLEIYDFELSKAEVDQLENISF